MAPEQILNRPLYLALGLICMRMDVWPEKWPNVSHPPICLRWELRIFHRLSLQSD